MKKMQRIAETLCVCLLLSVAARGTAAQEPKPEVPKASPDHEFLKRFVGEWDCETEATFAPGQPPVKSKGSMTGRMIGDFWAIVVVKGDALGLPYVGQGTFGYDSMKSKKYIGTWADSMSEFLWMYEGTVEGNKLILNSEGPNPSEPGKMIKGRDIWEFKGKDQVILTGEFQGPDGKFVTFGKTICTRTK